jgi:hypothetical protein
LPGGTEKNHKNKPGYDGISKTHDPNSEAHSRNIVLRTAYKVED